MIQDNFILLICLTFFVFSFGVFQSIEILKTKKSAVIQIQLLRNQIAEEKSILDMYNKEVVKIDEIEKDIHQKLVTLKTDVVTVDYSLSEFFKFVL